MNRRTFLCGLTLGSLRAPLVAEAQPGRKPARVVVLTNTSPPSAASGYKGLRDGLRDFGYVEGRNIVIDERGSDQSAEIARLAADIVSTKPDLIVAYGSTVLEPVKKVTQTIPIVMIAVPNPMNYVASISHPGGNITGLSNVNIEAAGKRLELMREIAPRLASVAVLYRPSAAFHARYLEETRLAALKLGITLHVVHVEEPKDLPSALAGVRRLKAEAVQPFPNGLFNTHRQEIAEFALANRLPMIYSAREMVEVGGLMSYGPDYRGQWRVAVGYIDKILKGAKPGDLPVEQPTRFELAINLKTAKALGLTIPQSLLLRADQVIE
jgi:putative ABC transport system substrate-binding protein